MVLFIISVVFSCFTGSLNGDEVMPKLPSQIIDDRLIADLRLLSTGAFAPLYGFMNENDYKCVLRSMRLENGALFPLPIVLPIPIEKIEEIRKIGCLILKDRNGHELAKIMIEDIYSPQIEEECLSCLGTLDPNHPEVSRVASQKNCCYVGGTIHPFPFLKFLDKEEGVLTPEETKAYFNSNGWTEIVAFQTRNPLHRAHVALIQKCLSSFGENAALFLHPVIGPTQDDDIPATIRKKCYEVIRPYLRQNSLYIGYLPLAMRMAGPKEALLHAIIRKNYGATVFIVGRDHAGPSKQNSEGNSFYSPYAAQKFVASFAEELGIKIFSSQEMAFVSERGEYVSEDECRSGEVMEKISGTELRERMQKNLSLPEWFSFPEVVKILSDYYRTKKNGLCVYFVGLPSSGKTTLAHALKKRLEAMDPLQREVIVLDADIVRSYLAAELGFSQKDRSANVQRMGYVASLIVQAGGVCVVANIAPFDKDRLINRALIESKGCYFEVFVDTPLEVCEQRDVKGLYRLAREGKIKNFAGVDESFEIPSCSDIYISGSEELDYCLDEICNKLKKMYFLYKDL